MIMLPRLFKEYSLVHCSSLMDLLHCVWDNPPPTLHMARQDLELTGVLRRIVENASSAVTNVRALYLHSRPSLSQFHVTCIASFQTNFVPVPCFNSFQHGYSSVIPRPLSCHVLNTLLFFPPISVFQIKRTAVLRHKQFKEKQLRSRQRTNYEHLLKRWAYRQQHSERIAEFYNPSLPLPASRPTKEPPFC